MENKINQEKTKNLEQTKIIRTKLLWQWSYVYDQLQMINNFILVMNDKGFYDRFKSLLNYVAEKINLPYEGNIKSVYIVVEQEAVNDDFEKWSKRNIQTMDIAVE